MKSQVKPAPAAVAALATRSWARFSPTCVMPASTRTPSSSIGHVLDGGEDLDVVAAELRADLGEVLARRAPASRPRISSAMRPPPAGRCAGPSRRWEKKSSGGVQMVHSPTSCTCVDAGGRGAARQRCLEVERAPASSPNALAELVADLVAARAGAGADQRGHRAAAAELAQRAHALLEDADRTPPVSRPRQPAWTIATAPSQSSATGRQSAVRTRQPTPGDVRGLPVAGEQLLARRPAPRRDAAPRGRGPGGPGRCGRASRPRPSASRA